MTGRHIGRRAAVPALVVVLLLASRPASQAASVPVPLASAERIVLDNGLVVLLLPEPGTGLVSVGMMYRVGAKNEHAGTTGLAHYAEHLNFRATRRFPGHEITEAVTRRGGRWTGYTWIDQTFYQTTLAKHDLGLALDLEADRMGGALYDPQDFEAERTSVIAELRSYDGPHSLLYDEVLAAAFQVHPYRNNTIGWLTDVESVSRDTAYEFYRRHYHPRNAVLAVGGDFEREAVLAAVRDRFASRPSGETDAHVTTVEPPLSGERRVTVRKPGPDAEVLLAFRAPALADPDFPALVLFDALLAGGKGLRFLTSYEARADAPLPRDLVASGRARSAETAFQVSLYPYVYTLGARTAQATGLAAAEAALFKSLEDAAEREWTEAELRQARAEVAAGIARDLDTLADRVHQLAFFEVSGGFEHLRDFASRLEETGGDAIRRFAKGRFARERATVGLFVPTPGAPVFSSGQASRVGAPVGSPTGTTPPSPRTSALTSEPPSTLRLGNGLTLVVTAEPRTRLLALRGRIEAGAVVTGRPALSVLALDLFALAARGGLGPPLVFTLDDAPGASVHDRSLEFSATGLPTDLPALAATIARGFAANAQSLDEARTRALARVESAHSDTDPFLAARARALLFLPASPLARPPWGEVEALREATPAEVEDVLRRFLTPARTALSVAGPVGASEVTRTFEEAFTRLGSSPSSPKPPPSRPSSPKPSNLAAEAPRGPATFTIVPVKREDASQNTIHVAVPGDRARPHDAAATSLLLYLLGETFYSGRLGRALVEPGLVYSVWTELQAAPGLHGYLVVQTAASKENTPEVVRRIRAVLEDAARGAFTLAELDEAKAYLRGKAARSRDGARLAARAALETAPPGTSPQSLTLEQLNDTARRLFARGAPIALVGGPGE